MELSDHVHTLTSSGRIPAAFKFRDQLREAAAAAPAHVAEGFGRFTPRDFANYLRMAVGTLAETRTHLERGVRQGYFTATQHADATRLCDRALDMTRKLLAAKLRQIAEEERQKQAARKPPPHR